MAKKIHVFLFLCALALSVFAALAFAVAGNPPSGNAPAHSVPVPAESAKVINLELIADYYHNADPALSIAELSAPEYATRFSPVAGRPVWVGTHAPAAWLRFVVPLDALGAGYAKGSDPAERTTQWLLLVKPSFSIILDSVEFYVPRPDGGFDMYASGAMKSASANEPHSRYFYFNLPPEAFRAAQREAPCYLRLSSSTDVLMNIELVAAAEFAKSEARSYLAYGIVFGILIAMAFYGFFLFVSLKYRSYLYFILYTISIGLWLFYVQGFAKVLFGQKPGLDQAMLWFWAGMFILWGTIFTISFLELKKGSRFLFYLLAAAAALAGVVSAAGLAGLDEIAFALSHYLGMAVPVLVIIAAAVRLKQGFRSALYYLVAWSFLALGGFVFSLMGLKVLPVHFLTINAMSIGMALESVLLSMALADRFKQVETERKLLESKQAQYRELSMTDALTGLYNKRYLQAELSRAVEKTLQSGEPVSLIFLDIDDFKKINDRFGHAVGDDILISLAHSMLSCTRESDMACRLGGDELVIFMPGISKDKAFHVAERIRVHFETESMRIIDGQSINATISLGIVDLQRNESAESLIERADSAMYAAKQRGKNCSVVL
jgi:diguanylate cyclase (GGDEF)-like protein